MLIRWRYIIFLCLGLFKNAPKNSLIIDSSTISPVVSKELNAKAKKIGMSYVDAPVSGGVQGAVAGTLTFMIGAESDAVFNRCKPFFDGMGKKFFNTGTAGNGQIAKLANNMSLAIQMIGICESLAFAERLGMDPAEASKIMSVSSARCHSVDTYNPVPGFVPTAPSGRDYENGFGSALMLKDAKLAVDACKEIGVNAELGAHSVEIYEKVVEKGFGKKDLSYVYELLRKDQL